MKLLSLLLGFAIATPLFGVDYRGLRATFDELMFRDNELGLDPEAVARRQQAELAEAKARADAELKAEKIRMEVYSVRATQPKPAPAREVIVGAGTDGRVKVGGPDRFHGPIPGADARPAAPAGFVWLFPLDPADFRVARKDPPGVTRVQDRRRFELESVQRAKNKYPFLMDTKDPRRVQFDRFLLQHSEMPVFKVFFSLVLWPELAADECASLNRW